MKKTLLMGMVGTSLLCAFNVEVKQAPVKLLINEENKEFKAGKKFSLNAGDIVCFIDGDGRVSITGETYKKQLSKRSKSCRHLPSEEGKPTEYAKVIKNSVVSMFAKSKETSVDGVSRKSVESDILTAPIYIGTEAKYLAIENSTWGPLPVRLDIVDENGKTIETMINEEDVVTSFILPRSMLKEGYSIKVSNAFEEPLVNSTIHLK